MKKTYKKLNLSIISHQVGTVILAGSTAGPQFSNDPAQYGTSVDARPGTISFDW